MTGYGRGELRIGERAFIVEARSYNSRFLDLKVRLGFNNRELEALVEAEVRRRLARGRVEVAVSEQVGEGGRLRLDEELAGHLGQALARLSALLGCDLATAAVLAGQMRELVGIEGTTRWATERVWPALEAGVTLALDRLLEMRRVEGDATARALALELAELERLEEALRALVQGEPALHRARIAERVRALEAEGVSCDPGRVAQEIAFLAERSDVTEELARLASHREQLRALLGAEGVIGRKLEFLLQELHRELNTIASKCVSAATAQAVVEAKAHAERMREQAQNVE